jgi:hypothetical protein
MAILFYQGDGLLKKVWVEEDWKPKLWLRGHGFFLINKMKIGDILAVGLEGLF